MDGFKVTNSTVLCEKHFTDADMKRNPGHWRLVSGAVPSVNLPSSSVTTEKRKSRKPPASRSTQTFIRSEDLDSSFAVDDSFNDFPDQELSPSTVSASTQTDFSFIEFSAYLPSDSRDSNNHLMKVFIGAENLKLETNELTSKISSLNDQLEKLELQLTQLKTSVFSVEKLKADNSATRFYTGFPNFSSLLASFEYLEPKVKRMRYWHGKGCSSGNSNAVQNDKSNRCRKRSLSYLEEFVMVLMRLKVGLFISDLANRFGISPDHFSKIFTTWISFLYNELPNLFPFPSQEHVFKNMPTQFKDFPNARIILDCTEVYTDVPSSMVSQS